MVLEEELFFEPNWCHAAESGHKALHMLRDLALGEFAGVTKAMH